MLRGGIAIGIGPRRERMGHGFAISAFLVLACLILPASAGATWSSVGAISPAGQAATSPRVAVAPSGDAVFAWLRFDGSNWRVQTRARSAGGGLSAVQTLSDAGRDATDPRVGVDASGNAVFAWRRFGGTNWRLQARARSAAGTLSSTQTLSATGVDALDPEIDLNPNGDAALAWVGFDGANYRIQGRTRSPTGNLSAIEILSAPDRDAQHPTVGLDASGNAVFAWERYDETSDCSGSACLRIQARSRSAAGALSATQNLSAAGNDARDPQLDVDEAGDAVFVWQRFDGANYRVQARARSAAGNLSSVQTLSAAGRGAGDAKVGVDANANAVFAWVRFDGSKFRVQARARSAAGSLSSVQTLSDAGRGAADPELGVDTDANALVAWRGLDGTSYRVQTRSRSATGTVGAVQTLSAGDVSEPPAISADPDGGLDPNVADGVAAWSRVQQSSRRIEAAAQIAPVGADATPPKFAGLESATTCIPGPIGGGQSSSYHLGWEPASDDVTPSSEIVYDVFQATKSGAEDFFVPTYTTPAGATSFATPPLPADKSYYFVVRARDLAGNRDSNTVELQGQNLCV